MKCCNGNGWYTSWSGGFAHPMPCEWCNPKGLPASAIEARRAVAVKQDAVADESAGPKDDAQGTSA